MENINKRTLLISANSGLIVLTSQMVFFVLDMFKDEGAKKCITSDWYLNVGISICLFCLPIIAFFTFLFFKFKGEPKSGSQAEKIVGFIIFINSIVSLANITGFMLILKPFMSTIGNYQYSFSLFSFIGFAIAIVCFRLFEWLINKRINLDKSQNDALNGAA